MLIKKVILTGARGFIGKHMLNRLLADNYHVVALKRPGTEVTSTSENVEWISFNDLECNKDKLKDIHGIIHLATDYGRTGENPLISQLQCNVLLPLQLLELARQNNIPRFLSADTFFGKFEAQYKYMKSYIMSKRHFKELAFDFASQSDVAIANVRLEHVYGEGDGANKFIPFVISSLKKDNEILKCTSAVQRRDFVYVDDVVDAFICILNHSPTDNFIEYEVGCGTSHKLKEMIEEIKLQMASCTEIEYGAVPMRSDEIMDSVADLTQLNAIGWSPKYDLRSGIREMLRK